ncbi:acyl-CoA N-acyltransferase [Atractiella rhizophila]|nr:acyl-CoA N-acyltransferase [Atractiella rhizophila]
MTIPQVKLHSSRLVYRNAQKADIPIFLEIFDSQTNLSARGQNKPQDEASWEKSFKSNENALYHVTICLPSGEQVGSTPVAGEIIGRMTLSQQNHLQRSSAFMIMLGTKYQGKGYGKEALIWLLEQGFCHQNLHKIKGEVFAWNEPAKRLYESIGFKIEGVERDCIFQGGAWQDNILMGMLESEWRERYGPKLGQNTS